jgi:hypothetical protein
LIGWIAVDIGLKFDVDLCPDDRAANHHRVRGEAASPAARTLRQ